VRRISLLRGRDRRPSGQNEHKSCIVLTFFGRWKVCSTRLPSRMIDVTSVLPSRTRKYVGSWGQITTLYYWPGCSCCSRDARGRRCRLVIKHRNSTSCAYNRWPTFSRKSGRSGACRRSCIGIRLAIAPASCNRTHLF
jgi:hypothetical protein